MFWKIEIIPGDFSIAIANYLYWALVNQAKLLTLMIWR